MPMTNKNSNKGIASRYYFLKKGLKSKVAK